MPPSGRGKGKTRARRGGANNVSDAIHEPSDIDTPDALATPSRSSRKRARGAAESNTQAARNVRRKVKDSRTGVPREYTEGTEAQDASDNDTQPALPTEQEIVASLKVAERQVNATEDFANDLLEGQENVPGYGKIAGRDWAFIIRKVEVNIGRPEAHERLPTEGEAGSTSGPSAKTVVDIDLGPDRQVSRSHAIISYDGDKASWFIIVNGRNGLRVDNNLLKRGSKSYLRNGSVIEIAGTQMAFITSTGEDSEGPVWDGSIIRQAQKSSEEDEDGEDDHRLNGRTPALRRATLQDTSRLPREYNTHGNGAAGQQNHRAHPHSSRAANSAASFQQQPGTPTRNTAGSYSMMKSSPNATFARGIAVESTESIDYSASTAKDLKPPHSYAQLIGMAILSTSEQQMTLSNIYKWIMANYAFYRFNTGGWQNSIRHNLSLNKAFVKIARRTDEPGKGMKWMIEPTEFDSFVSQGMKGCRRPPLQVPSSSQHISATQATLPDGSSPLAIRNIKQDMSPPGWNATGHPGDATTPELALLRARNGDDETAGAAAAETLDYLRTTPRNGLSGAANNAGSPPALFLPDDNRITAGVDTPFPLKPAQRLAPPSSLKRPSDFIQFSSPAPFWKMEGLVGNTPWKFDLSPLKTPFTGFNKIPKLEADEEKMLDGATDDSKPSSASTDEPPSLYKAELSDNGDEKQAAGEAQASDARLAQHRHNSPMIPSSSPPRPMSAGLAAAANGSPTATRPGSRLATSMTAQAASGAKGLTLLAAATQEAEKDGQHSTPPDAAMAQGGASRMSNGYVAAAPTPFDDGEDEGIDLAKGFQPIGAFHHKQRFSSAPMGMQPVAVTGQGRTGYGR